jgi:iron uptake system EfeUOB component EfeO/EfeM
LLLPARLVLITLVFAATAAQAADSGSFEKAAEDYRHVLTIDMDRALAGARTLRDRLAGNDVAAAKTAWIDARVGWERSEVFTGSFIPKLDNAIDAWPDAKTGFHGIEAALFGAKDEAFGSEPDNLVQHLSEADERVRVMPLTAQGLFNGVTQLAYEVGDSKVDGGESRLSGTSLDDMRNNVDGIKVAYGIMFAPSLQTRDSKLAAQIGDEIERLKTLVTVKDLRSIDPDELQKASEALIVALQAAAPKLGLAPPALEGPAL